MKKLLTVILAVMFILLPSCSRIGNTSENSDISVTSTAEQNSDAIIKQLFDEQKSDVEVTGTGTVTILLADDNDGSRHQRFILELASGQTLLVAHNIDIAPRLDGLTVGDTVEFKGEYYYNDEGGGIHWTHHDPDGVHVSGYLKWNGKIY
ncbi:MAG: DUF3465 domain-containing protein [Oscillospiraceae bacterium]|nr:DUF3465 domain-containing protein [Oscillospiraceae bacterium]